MRTYYVRFSFSNGYCGCDEEDYICRTVANDDISQSEVDNSVQREFEDEMYEYLENYESAATGGWDEDWESEEEKEEYYQGEYCNWEYITEEEYHEGRRNNGEEE